MKPVPPLSQGFDFQHPLLHEYILSGLETSANLEVVCSKQMLLLYLLSLQVFGKKLKDDVVFRDFFALDRSEVILESSFCVRKKQKYGYHTNRPSFLLSDPIFVQNLNRAKIFQVI